MPFGRVKIAVSAIVLIMVTSPQSATAGGGMGAVRTSEGHEYQGRQVYDTFRLSDNLNAVKNLIEEDQFNTAQSTPSVRILSPQEELERIEAFLAIAEIIDVGISLGIAYYVGPAGSIVYGASKTLGFYTQALATGSESTMTLGHEAALSTVLSIAALDDGINGFKATALGLGFKAKKLNDAFDVLSKYY